MSCSALMGQRTVGHSGLGQLQVRHERRSECIELEGHSELLGRHSALGQHSGLGHGQLVQRSVLGHGQLVRPQFVGHSGQARQRLLVRRRGWLAC